MSKLFPFLIGTSINTTKNKIASLRDTWPTRKNYAWNEFSKWRAWKYSCFPGFDEGFIRWDDENTDNNNNYRGTLPDGKYGENTLIKYCCRTDGFATNPIILPTDQPFVLFKSNSHQCQQVQGMHAHAEWFKWDTEDWSFSGNEKGGSIPYGEVGRNIKLDYCYYTRSWTEAEINYWTSLWSFKKK